MLETLPIQPKNLALKAHRYGHTTMIGKFILKFLTILIKSLRCSLPVGADRPKDLTSIAGVRTNQLVGYGIVVGLAGTGDGNIGLTLQSMQSMVSRFGLATDVKGLDGKNTAAVMVTGELALLENLDAYERYSVNIGTVIEGVLLMTLLSLMERPTL